jgi:hypothetical protein
MAAVQSSPLAGETVYCVRIRYRICATLMTWFLNPRWFGLVCLKRTCALRAISHQRRYVQGRKQPFSFLVTGIEYGAPSLRYLILEDWVAD